MRPYIQLLLKLNISNALVNLNGHLVCFHFFHICPKKSISSQDIISGVLEWEEDFFGIFRISNSPHITIDGKGWHYLLCDCTNGANFKKENNLQKWGGGEAVLTLKKDNRVMVEVGIQPRESLVWGLCSGSSCVALLRRSGKGLQVQAGQPRWLQANSSNTSPLASHPYYHTNNDCSVGWSLIGNDYPRWWRWRFSIYPHLVKEGMIALLDKAVSVEGFVDC